MKTDVTKSIAVSLLTIHVAASQCTICENGAAGITEPDNILSIPGFPPFSCSSVDSTLAVFVADETSDQCTTIRSLGSLCGCPVPADSCSLCPSGDAVGLPDNELPFLSDLFLGSIPTCEILEAYLKSQSQKEAICIVGRSFISDYCGCGEDLDGSHDACSLCPEREVPPNLEQAINLPDFPFKSCAELYEGLQLLLVNDSEECSLMSQTFASMCGCAMQQDSCSLCRDGSPVSMPDATLEVFQEQFGGIVPTCQLLESYVASQPTAGKTCVETRLFGSICGCAPVEDHCVFCPGEELSEEHQNTTVHKLELIFGFTSTCGFGINYLQYQVESSSTLCQLGISQNHVCGCSGGHWSYLDATTITKQAVLAWVPRISAIFTLVGSASIIWDILSSQKRRNTLYSQLVLGMSIFDFIGGVAWALSTLPIPEYDKYGDYSFIYGAQGNAATCMAQGLAIQLNFTSIFYNISLSVYYVLVIVFSWRTCKLKKVQKWLHIFPLTVGIGLALGGIPFYQFVPFGCHIQSPPLEKTWYPVVFLSFLPIFSSLAATSIMMGFVYWKVKAQAKKSERWNITRQLKSKLAGGPFEQNNSRPVTSVPPSLPLDNSEGSVDASPGLNRLPKADKKIKLSVMERRVFYQSALYLFSFYITWIFILAATIRASPMTAKESENDVYPFYLVTFIMAPLQGFFNALIYFRYRLASRWQSLRSGLFDVERTSSLSWFQRASKHSAENPSPIASENMEPSADIARLSSFSHGGSDEDGVGQESVERTLQGIQEELEQLENAELEIEEFQGDAK